MAGKYWDIGVEVVSGCTRISSGCKNCWSLAKDKRFNRSGPVRFNEKSLRRFRKKPKTVFAIWNDLFHEAVTYEQIDQVFNVLLNCERHIYLILTKRAERMYRYISDSRKINNLPRVWFGITAEDQPSLNERWDYLKNIDMPNKYISAEPLLGPLEIPGEVSWVIAGAETGAGKRRVNIQYLVDIQQQCSALSIPFYFKVDSDGNHKLDGKVYEEYPKGIAK